MKSYVGRPHMENEVIKISSINFKLDYGATNSHYKHVARHMKNYLTINQRLPEIERRMGITLMGLKWKE